MSDKPLKTEVRSTPPSRSRGQDHRTYRGRGTRVGLLKDRGEEPQEPTVNFFDTPELELFDVGLVLRARKIKGDIDDTTVKVRPVDQARIPIDSDGDRGLRGGDGPRLGHPDDLGRVDGQTATQQDRRGHKGERPLQELLLSADQERLIAEFGPRDVGWEALTPMGPIEIQEIESRRPEAGSRGRRRALEAADRSDLVELSIKVAPGEATAAADAFVAFLEAVGLEVGGDQQTRAPAP